MDADGKTKSDAPEMQYFVQLKLLLWKNWLLRKRNKFQTVAEILWSILMILVVVLLHNVGEKLAVPNCHMKAKAMPSAGEILFLQTFLCAVNNTCDMEKNATMQCFSSSIISILSDALLKAFDLSPNSDFLASFEIPQKEGNSKKESKFSLETKDWMKDFFVVESLIEAIQKPQHYKWDELNELIHKEKNISYTCGNSYYTTFDQGEQSKFKRNVESCYNCNNETEELELLLRTRRKIYKSGVFNSFYQYLSKNLNNNKNEEQSLTKGLHLLDFIFCGTNVPSIMMQAKSLISSGTAKSKESEQTLNTENIKYVIEDYQWENDTTDFCNELMRSLESTYASRIVFRLLKPLIRGKLIYTPAAPVVNRVMAKINATLLQIKGLIDLIKTSKKDSFDFESKLMDVINRYKNDESFLRKIVETKTGKIFLKQVESNKEDEYNKEEEENMKQRIKKFQQILDDTLVNLKGLFESSSNSFNVSSLIPYLECIDLNRLIAVPNESTAVKEALKWLNYERLWGLIVFVNVSSDADKLPPTLTYKIRTGIERTPDTHYIRDRIYVPRVKRNMVHDLRDITGGFAYLQNMIEGELIREYTGRKTLPGIYLKQTPYPCHIYDTFRDVITRTFPMFMVISWIYAFCMISKRIVFEKEIFFKGTLRIFGVKASQYWISWFIDAFVPMILVTTLTSILLVEGGLIPNSNIFVVWLFLSTFILPTISLAFLVSTFFFKASLAMACSGMIYFILYLPYPSIQNFVELIHPYFKISACLISNVAFGLGCTWIANMEELGVGAQLDKINFSPVPGNPITMSLIIRMFVIDSLIYLLLALYFDNVLGASDFVKHPWYYFVTSSYWRGTPRTKNNGSENFVHKEREKDPRYFEAEPEGLKVGIEIINLTKDFEISKKKKRAVNKLNINFYEDQITSFLGHNGAGKTTTISMMIGLLPITEGTVRIYGVDIKANPSEAVKDMGICRQENVLLDDLTVEEHFILFARLKNRSLEEIQKDMISLLGDLQLGHRAKQPVKILSGGMKRKVCVAMAFIGGSRTVFLDEPTAGIDPFARRSIWELIIKYKKGRTIILTTHFLDEAYLLGDRIAVISSGELQCCGSGLFLKSQFGRGYYLIIESNHRSNKVGRKAKGLKHDAVHSLQVQKLESLIKEVIPGAEFSEEVGSEIVFILPSNIEAVDFNKLFDELDKNKKELNFSSYGVTDTSFEEVFMKVLLEAEAKKKAREKPDIMENNEIVNSGSSRQQENKEINTRDTNLTCRILKVNSKKMFKEHFIALMIKRFLHHTRNFKIVLIELFLPTLFMAIALALAKVLPTISEMPPLVIDMSAYSPSNFFYSNNYPKNSHLAAYEKSLLSPYGLGTKCVLYPEECTLKEIEKSSLISEGAFEDSKSCLCHNGFFECLQNESLIPPPHAKMSSGDTLYNLTGLNLTNWLLTTEFEYSANRFGGITFGHVTSLTEVSLDEFLNLFMFDTFGFPLKAFLDETDFEVDPLIVAGILMYSFCNKSYGDKLFKEKDPADNIIIWYNNRGWIADLAMMNGVTNLVLRASLPNGTDPSKYSIRLINHPLPITKRQLEDQIKLQTNVALLCALSVIWALSFIPAMYSVYLVEERVSGLKHLQIVSGISRTVYWFTNLIWDLMAYSISIVAIVLLYLIFQMNAFIGKESILAFIVILYSYGFVNITFVYLVSFLFTVPSNAFIFIACWNILLGIATLLSKFTLTLNNSKENPYYLEYIFLLCPQFCFGNSLINMSLEGIRKQTLQSFGMTPIQNSFAWNLTTKYIITMLFIGIIFFIFTFLVEYHIFERLGFIDKMRQLSKSLKNNGEHDEEKEDDDVKRERERVMSGKAKDDGDVLIINNLTKIYSRREPPAVNCICVGIKHGECFGLLGLNGAGKSTVFKMLTGCITPNEGDATIGGYSIVKNPRQAKLLMGYCPQANALDSYLTAEEHLSFFCRIRGVSGKIKEKEVKFTIERLGLTEQRNKIVKVLSGGNKRKVNTAIALVCEPELVLLDEPTSGMDVLSRRFLWNCIQEVVLEGRCVVLTSHSMEECQALCTHLSIMANGKFICFGSSQHLKAKFNEGYSVTVRLVSLEKTQLLIEFFEKNLPNSVLVHVHHLQVRYKLSPEVFIGSVFTYMSEAKKEQLIQDYSISQATLESIFLKLATKAEKAKRPDSKQNFFKKLYFSEFLSSLNLNVREKEKWKPVKDESYERRHHYS